MNQNQSTKSKEKKIVLILLAAMALIVMISIPVLISSMQTGEGDDETTRLIYFETPNYEENIFEDEEYLGKNRLVYVIKGAIGTYVDTSSEAERAAESHVSNFMFDFIETQIQGDVDGYNACFSEEYLAKNGKQEKFTMQKLYDISIEQYGSATPTDDGGRNYTYILKYKILHNNGTLRNDIESMSERPLYLIIHEDDSGNFAITTMRAR